MKKLLPLLLLVVLLVGCKDEGAKTPNSEPIGFRIQEQEENRAILYFDAQEGKVKFEGDTDLAAQRFLEILQSAIDEYIRENCQKSNGSIRKAGRFHLATENN